MHISFYYVVLKPKWKLTLPGLSSEINAAPCRFAIISAQILAVALAGPHISSPQSFPHVPPCFFHHQLVIIFNVQLTRLIIIWIRRVRVGIMSCDDPSEPKGTITLIILVKRIGCIDDELSVSWSQGLGRTHELLQTRVPCNSILIAIDHRPLSCVKCSNAHYPSLAHIANISGRDSNKHWWTQTKGHTQTITKIAVPGGLLACLCKSSHLPRGPLLNTCVASSVLLRGRQGPAGPSRTGDATCFEAFDSGPGWTFLLFTIFSWHVTTAVAPRKFTCRT